MKAPLNKKSDKSQPAAAYNSGQKQDTSIAEGQKPSQENTTQKHRQDLVNNSSQAKETAQLQAKADQFIQRKENKTGLPDNLKSGIENLSGLAMDDVKVHYNSGKPAQLNAHAYAQGTDIHVASGQEKHLAHEAWHVVQQKQGRVKPTTEVNGGVKVNDDKKLEQEADVMGSKATQLKSTAEEGLSNRPDGPKLYGILQLVHKEIGKIDHSGEHPGGIIDRPHVVAELGEPNTLSWPTDASNTFFNDGNYGGSVTRAMDWGLTGGEGTGGWTTRNYTPQEFHNLANDAFAATRGLNNAVLNNESNKTLIAIRTFRASDGSGMADRTLQDLQVVLQGVNDARVNLAASNLIANAGDNVTEVKADPAEAHPNTLPTAKITFAGGGTLYFKGRGGDVENALVGTNSAAHAISQLGVPNAGEETGTHAFESEDHTHISEDVGPPAPHGPVSNEEAIRAWVSAAKTAALVSLSGTGDLHGSNVIDAAGATKHIIDAEFLLDATAWANYEAAAQTNEITNFEVDSMVPQWAIDYTATLNTVQKLQLSDIVAQRFQALGLNNDDTLEQIIAPLRNLVLNEALLRISPMPFTTAFWLARISAYRESDDTDEFMAETWNFLSQVYPDDYHINLANRNNVLQTLRQNFENGMVPLFHLGASTGTFYLNKDTYMGSIQADRRADRFLDLTKTALLNGYDNMVLKLRAAIVDTR